MPKAKSKNEANKSVYDVEPFGKTHVQLKCGTESIFIGNDEFKDQFNLIEEVEPKKE